MSDYRHNTSQETVLFVADIHLTPSERSVTERFLSFLAGPARGCDALYILGDLYDAWIGDDAASPDEPTIRALAALTQTGVPVRVMHGNRDFLLGGCFAAMTGVELLTEPASISLDGQPTLLMHGDSLCTDDIAYQRIRRMVRDPDWQRQILALPVNERIAYAQWARGESDTHTSTATTGIMDVNEDAVLQVMQAHSSRLLLHGHTHRPGRHTINRDGLTGERIVLGDWPHGANVVRAAGGNLTLEQHEDVAYKT